MQTQLVKKTAIIESGDFNLSASRYLEKIEINSDFQIVKLNEVIDYEQPNKYIVNDTNYNDSYKTPVLTAGKTFILGYTDEIDGIFPDEKLPVIIFDDFTTASKYVDFQFKVKSSAMKILHINRSKAIPLFIYHVMQDLKFDFNEHKRFWISQYSNLEIPLPSLEIQKQIVKEIEEYQLVIDGCRQVVENYRPIIDIDPNWDFVEMDDFVNYRRGSTITKDSSIHGNIPVIGGGKKSSYYHNEANRTNNVITISSSGANAGYVNYFDIPIFASDCFTIESKDYSILSLLFLFYYLKTVQNQIYLLQTGAAQPHVYSSSFKNFKIPLPSIEAQKEIVQKIIEQRKVIEGNKELINIYENKIKARISKIWSDN
tara:strand:- start:1680 stop:2792 length:1113 start_codon:yes stop_codon:yes gene_type:complete